MNTVLVVQSEYYFDRNSTARCALQRCFKYYLVNEIREMTLLTFTNYLFSENIICLSMKFQLNEMYL